MLGSLLFVIFIDDIRNNKQSKLRLFADDTSMYHSSNNILISENMLNQDLENVLEWTEFWQLPLNLKKCVAMFIGKVSTRPQLLLNGNMIQYVDRHKHLGLHLTPKPDWSLHVYEVTKKCKYTLYLMRCFKNILSTTTLDQIYKSYILPVISYVDVIYACAKEIQTPNTALPTVLAYLKPIARLQYDAALTVSGAMRLSSRDKVLNILGWLSLEHLFAMHKILL
ncbi:unnamed protein product, partial [Didymodactylos carnosus]